MPSMPRRVVLESPYSGDVENNLVYARACLADCLKRGEAPIAYHLLHTQPGVLDDTIAEERAKGMLAGHVWIAVADAVVVYIDRGVSDGMREGIRVAKQHRIPIVIRKLNGEQRE
jgi:hypothetical protein